MSLRVYFLTLAIVGLALVVPAEVNPVLEPAEAYVCRPSPDLYERVSCEIDRAYECISNDITRCPR